MTSYDEIIYPGRVYPDTHPDHLAAIATLFGMQPAPLERCRVLEVACGDAGNLIPMAAGLPGSEFVGFDLAAAPIELGKEMVRRLGLANVSLSQCDLTQFPASAGRFDYIIAHGLYSWVPPEVRDALLALIGARLSPSGVAFVSYNVYPGCYARQMLWEMLRFHTDHLESPRARIDEALALARMVRGGRSVESEQCAMLAHEAGRLLERNPAFLFHDDLSEFNEPVYFHQFVEHATQHDLQFLSEAELLTMSYSELTPETALVLESMDLLAREQYLDFMRCRRFRQTLLCHSAVQLDRQIRLEKLDSMRFGMRTPVKIQDEALAAPPTDMLSDHPQLDRTGDDTALLQGLLDALRSAAPGSLALDEVARAVSEGPAAEAFARRGRDALSRLMLGAVRVGAIHPHVYAPRLAAQPSERPLASPVARMQIETDTVVSGLRHEPVNVDNETAARLLRLLDGTRDRSALLVELGDALKVDAEMSRSEALEAHLRQFAKVGLLVA